MSALRSLSGDERTYRGHRISAVIDASRTLATLPRNKNSVLRSEFLVGNNPVFELDRTSFFRIDKAMNSLLFVASAGRFTGYDPG